MPPHDDAGRRRPLGPDGRPIPLAPPASRGAPAPTRRERVGPPAGSTTPPGTLTDTPDSVSASGPVFAALEIVVVQAKPGGVPQGPPPGRSRILSPMYRDFELANAFMNGYAKGVVNHTTAWTARVVQGTLILGNRITQQVLQLTLGQFVDDGPDAEGPQAADDAGAPGAPPTTPPGYATG